jgi:hypothetical protein
MVVACWRVLCDTDFGLLYGFDGFGLFFKV